MGISNVTSNIRPGICTSTTRPTAPYEGQIIYETDTDKVYTYNGSNWVLVYTTNGGPVVFQSTPPTDTNVLWADTSIGGSNTAVPVGGTTGQVLTKSTSTDYDTSWTGPMGLVLIKTQTIGSAVSSVEVTSAFSADYDNYKIIVSGGAGSASSDLRLTLGASATAYYYGGILRTYAAVTAPFEGSNVAYWVAGIGSAQTLTMNVDLLDPYNANETSYMTFLAYAYTTGGGAFVAGYHNAATSYTSFKITPSTGTLTGGTIRVYGYRN